MKIYPFRATLPDLSKIEQSTAFFNQVREGFPHLFSEGYFLPEADEAIYLYSISDSHGTHTGVIGLVPLTAWAERRILPHEHTITEKVNRQEELLAWRQAAVKPVLLTYRAQASIQNWIWQYQQDHEPVQTVQLNEETHRCWRVSDVRSQSVLALLLANIDRAYVADGHHRLESTHQYYQQHPTQPARVLCGLFGHQTLTVDSFHRAVRTQLPLDRKSILQRFEPYCYVSPLPAGRLPATHHELTCYAAGQWYLLIWREEILEKHARLVERLDTALLNRYLLHDALGIEDVRTSDDVRYLPAQGDTTALVEKIDSRENAMGFCLYPIDVQTMMAVADEGEVLPPKSTWFCPRLQNGILVQKVA